jgi:hypothetical protein
MAAPRPLAVSTTHPVQARREIPASGVRSRVRHGRRPGERRLPVVSRSGLIQMKRLRGNGQGPG